MARLRRTPAPEPLSAHARKQGEEIGPPKEVLAVHRYDLIAGTVAADVERVGQRRSWQPPSAAMHGPAYIDHVGVLRIAAMSLQIHDGRPVHRTTSTSPIQALDLRQ